MAQIADIASAGKPDVRNDPRLKPLREVAGQVMGSVFFGTLLKTLRESPLKGTYGHGGQGEEIFQAQLHQVFAERAGAARNNGLTDALVSRLAPQQLRMEASRPQADNGRWTKS
jgi:Rod binding domain-containing protein